MEEGLEPGFGRMSNGERQGSYYARWGRGDSTVRISLYTCNVLLTLSPSCSSASWSRVMIVSMNSSEKEQSGGYTSV